MTRSSSDTVPVASNSIADPTEHSYELALRANPRQPDVWRALGEVRFKRRKFTEAKVAYEKALSLDDALASGHFGLAAVCKEQGRSNEAIDGYHKGLSIEPTNTEARLALAMILAGLSQTSEAIQQWQTVVQQHPEHSQAIHNLGVAYAQQGEPGESVRHFRRALQLKPDYAEAHYNLANVLNNADVKGKPTADPALPGTRLSRREEAIRHYLAAIRIRPSYAEAYHNLGSLLTELGRPAEAVVWLRQAVRLCAASSPNRPAPTPPSTRTANSPVRERSRIFEAYAEDDFLAHSSMPSALNQLGLAFTALARYREAERCYNRALDYKPEMADVHSNLGNLFQERGRLPEALASYELAMAQDPDSVSTRWNRALSLLQVGKYELGWREYEWRWKRKQTPARPFRQPRWDGSDLKHGTLFIYMEQGLGDILQFIRYAELARSRVGRLIVECPYFVMPLLERCHGIDELIPEERNPQEVDTTDVRGRTGTASRPCQFDVQIPLMSLPAVLRTTLETIPNQVPYLFVEQTRIDKWRDILAQVADSASQRRGHSGSVRHDSSAIGDTSDAVRQPSSVQVGIVWQGNPNHRLDRYRSIKLAEFAPLARIPGVQLVSLQKGPGAAQIEELPQLFPIWKPPIVEEMTAEALLDTAALMKNLDLIICVDTGTAHLAGGLGLPVWTLLSAIGEWRWLLKREDSPWYPTMRLFRQQKLGRWRPVFHKIASELRKKARGS